MAESKLDEIIAKAQAKKEASKERKAEKEEQGIVNKLVIERSPAGLYTCHYALRGNIPDELKGYFTRKERILAVARQRGIEVADETL